MVLFTMRFSVYYFTNSTAQCQFNHDNFVPKVPDGDFGDNVKGRQIEPIRRPVLLIQLVYSPMARYRKVTTWPLVQVPSGTKVDSVMPLVTPFSTAQATAVS